MYRDRSPPLRVLRATARHAFRFFAATATGTVLSLVYWNTVFGVFAGIDIHYGPPALDALQPTPVVAVATYLLPAVIALAAGRYLARRCGRSRHLATSAVAILAPFVIVGASISNVTAPMWAVYPMVYLVLVVSILPPVVVAAWVLDATERRQPGEQSGGDVA